MVADGPVLSCPVLLLLVCRSLVFIWDSEALQLHGVFRVDSNARELPLSEVPGNRPQQVRLFDWLAGCGCRLVGCEGVSE